MNKILENCIDNINRFLKLDVFISVGSTEKGYQSACKSYTAAKDLQTYSLILSKNRIIDCDEFSKAAIERQAKVDINFEDFHHYLTAKKEEDCIRFINESFNRVCAIKGITPVFIQNIAVEILYHVSDVLNNSFINDRNIQEDMKINFSNVYGINTIEELTYWLEQVVKKTIGILKSEDDKHSPLIKQVLGYIHNNYNKDISIKLLSSCFNINAAYLGQLFKNETGEMLTNYLNNIRIEKAKEMLLNTNLRAVEISEKVGYVNVNYFYRIFKKITGISPTEWR